jgi:hypothetical protein
LLSGERKRSIRDERYSSPARGRRHPQKVFGLTFEQELPDVNQQKRFYPGFWRIFRLEDGVIADSRHHEAVSELGARVTRAQKESST